MPPAMSLLLTVVLLAIAQVVAEPPDPPEHVRLVSIHREEWMSWSYSNPDQRGLIFYAISPSRGTSSTGTRKTKLRFEKRNDNRLYSKLKSTMKPLVALKACIEVNNESTEEHCSSSVKFPEETEEITTCETAEDPPYEQNASRDPEFEEWPAKPKDVQYKTVNKRTWIRWDHPEKSTGKVTFHYCSGSEMYPYDLPNIISERYGNCPPMYTYTGTPKKLYVFACEERDGLKCCSPYIEATETPDAESSLAPPRQDTSGENNPENETPDAESSLAPPGQDQSREYNPENETPDAESSMAPSGQDQLQKPPAPQNARLVLMSTQLYLSWDYPDLSQKVTFRRTGKTKDEFKPNRRADNRLYALLARKLDQISIKACFFKSCSDEVKVQGIEKVKTCKKKGSEELYEQIASRDPRSEAWPAAPKDVHYFKQTNGEEKNILIIWDHPAKSPTSEVKFEMILQDGHKPKAHYWFWTDLPDCPLMHPLIAKKLTSLSMRAVETREEDTCYSEYVEATEYNEKSGTLAAGSSLTSSGHEPSQGQKPTPDSQPTQRKRQRVSYSQEGGSSTSRRRVGGPQGEGPSTFQRRDGGPQEKSRSDSKGKGREYNPESETLAAGSSLTSSGHEPSQGKKRAHLDDLVPSLKRQKISSDSQRGGASESVTSSTIYRLLNPVEKLSTSTRQGEGGGPQEKPSTSSDRQEGGGASESGGRVLLQEVAAQREGLPPSLARILN